MKCNVFRWVVTGKCRPQWNLFFGADQSGTRLGSLFCCNFGDNNSIKFLVLDDRSIFVKTAGILRIHKLMFLFCFHVAPPAGAVLTFGGINNFHDIMTNAVKEKRISVKNCRLRTKLIKTYFHMNYF